MYSLSLSLSFSRCTVLYCTVLYCTEHRSSRGGPPAQGVGATRRVGAVLTAGRSKSATNLRWPNGMAASTASILSIINTIFIKIIGQKKKKTWNGWMDVLLRMFCGFLLSMPTSLPTAASGGGGGGGGDGCSQNIIFIHSS